MTNDEYRMYEFICKSHDPNGKDLFKGMFEVDDEGLIQYLLPPKTKFSLTVVIFLQNLMLHQHLRIIYSEHNNAMKEISALKEEMKSIISKVKG